MALNRSVVLTSRDIASLRTALETILTPIFHSTPEEWGTAVMREIGELLRADQMLFALPLDGQVRITGDGDRTRDAAKQYTEEYWQTDFVVAERRKKLGLEVYHRDELYKSGELRADVLHNEWCVPNKLFDTLGMGVQVSDTTIPAGVHAYHNRPDSREFGTRGHLLMEMLLPAFRASVTSYSLLLRHRESIGRLIDSIAIGVCVIDTHGSIGHINPALERLRNNDPHWQPVHAAIERAGRLLARNSLRKSSITALPAINASEQIRTATMSYAIRCSITAGTAELPESLGVVFVQTVEANAARIQQRVQKMAAQFRLTQRETEVALLLIQRFHGDEIAQRLGISTHTVRHHTESIFRKVGVNSRSGLASACSD
jgi:DNA-binding CsgD family transcriptional regulator